MGLHLMIAQALIECLLCTNLSVPHYRKCNLLIMFIMLKCHFNMNTSASSTRLQLRNQTGQLFCQQSRPSLMELPLGKIRPIWNNCCKFETNSAIFLNPSGFIMSLKDVFSVLYSQLLTFILCDSVQEEDELNLNALIDSSI